MYIGFFNNLEVQITTKSDVIIIVRLQRALSVPVQLFLVYTSLDDSSQQQSRVTQAAYLNTTVIQHIEFASQVTFDHFEIQVGLFSGGVYGPLTTAPGEHGE